MRWVTTERVQVDRLASAWLIRRFVDREAEFAFVPRDTPVDTITDGTPFYMPGAAWGKQGGRSTFEAILNTYHLADAAPSLTDLGAILRAVDELHGPVAFRGIAVREALPPDAPPETAGLQMVLHGVRVLSATDAEAIAAVMPVLDAAYAALQARRERTETR